MEQIKANETLVDSSLRETKMHGTVDFPVGVYLDDFSDFKNGYICWHWHEEIQISWIIEGEFLCQMEGRTVHLAPRRIDIRQPGCAAPRSTRCKRGTASCTPLYGTRSSSAAVRTVRCIRRPLRRC